MTDEKEDETTTRETRSRKIDGCIVTSTATISLELTDPHAPSMDDLEERYQRMFSQLLDDYRAFNGGTNG